MRRASLWGLLIFLVGGIVLAQDEFNGCGLEGTAKPKSLKALNVLKNRSAPLTDADVDSTATLKKMLKLGDDEERFDEEQGVEVVGWVYEVKPGGKETCNCGATEAEFKDTHIELVPSPTINDKTHRVVIEVTPRWRAKMADEGEDWSTAALRTKFKHKWVRVRGWLLYDVQHVHNAEHTNPGGSNVWRATAWEVHPITSIELTAAP